MLKKLFRKLFNIRKDVMSFKESMCLTGLPFVSFYQGDKQYRFLLDTGSNDNIIDSCILNDIEHEMIDYKGTLSGLDAMPYEVTACHITLDYQDNKYPFVYIVKDMSGPFGMLKSECGIQIHGIIGSRFFNKFKYVLDFDELIAYSKK